VPPSYSECPNCLLEAQKAGTAEPAAEQVAQPEPVPARAADSGAVAGTPSSIAAVPLPPSSAPPPAAAGYTPAPPPPGAPVAAAPRSWNPILMTALFAAAFIALAAGGYYLYQQWNARPATAFEAVPEAAAPTPTAAGGAPVSPYQKYLEVTGIRISEDEKQNVEVRYLLVNHSRVDMAGLKGQVELRRTTDAADSQPLMVLPLDIPSLGPYASRELVARQRVKMRAYELPDWQFIRPTLRLTAPR
jgi:hypothetical protein